MSLPKDKAWFPTKTYGYGWGLPKRWQGWVVLVAYITALVGGITLVEKNTVYFVGYVFGLTAVAIGICWWKGEAARWRWGSDEKTASEIGLPDDIAFYGLWFLKGGSEHAYATKRF